MELNIFCSKIRKKALCIKKKLMNECKYLKLRKLYHNSYAFVLKDK